MIGNLSAKEAAIKLREVGEEQAAELLDQFAETSNQIFGPGERKRRWPFEDKPWQYTTHIFGYLAPAPSGSNEQAIYHVDEIAADPSLRGERVQLTMDRLRIVAYPGGGIHCILLHVSVQHQTWDKTESTHFSVIYRIREGQFASVQGYPLFTGLNIGQEGLTLRCRTITIRNDEDEALLSFLESEPFKAGVRLVATAQPGLAPHSEMTLTLAKMTAAHHRNISVQDFDLRLDFSTIPLHGRLAEGAYIALQIPESLEMVWDWDEWIYLSHEGLVVRRDNHQQLIPYNYLIFGLGRIRDSFGGNGYAQARNKSHQEN